MTLFSALRSVAVTKAPAVLNGINDSRGWSSWFMGPRDPADFQRDIHVNRDAALTHWAAFSCITLISADAGKVGLQLVEKTQDGIWVDAGSAAFSPVLRKPNRFQTRQKFIELWLVSKLTHGNTYVLLDRDKRGIVVSMYVLDPHRVTPLVAPNGDVYYRLAEDDLAQVPAGEVVVPASEIIHDTMVCLFGHPLCGISPMRSASLAIAQGLNIQKNAARFFENMSRPSGILTSDQEITDVQAEEYRARWQANYGAEKVGKVAVLGAGLKYEGVTQNAVDSQMFEMLGMSAKMVCSTFHVPPFKVNVEALPVGVKVEDMNLIYYNDCLQPLLDSIETLLDFGLGLDTPKDGHQYGTMFNLDDLMKMDSATLTTVLKDQVSAGITEIDEARKRINLPPTPGGNTAYLQQQNYSLAALAKRDSSDDPFATAKPAATTPPPALPAPSKEFDAFALEMRSALDSSMAALTKDIGALRERIEEVPEVDPAEIELSGAKNFADYLKRQFDEEPVCG